MAIQNRRGIYSDFDPTKMVEGEFAVVQSGDPDTIDGKSVYISTQTGSVERVALHKDITQAVSTAIDEVTEDVIEDINEGVAENVERAETAADNAEASAEEAAEILENKADIDGTYDNLVAGNLLSDQRQNDSVPYLLRATADELGSSRIGQRCYETIIGASVGENQLVQSGATSVTVPNGHKYYSKINGTESLGTSTGSAIAINDSAKDMVTDLSLYLPANIVDYIYSLESATAGAGIAKLREWGFLRGYQAHNAGSIESVEVTGKKVVGFNQWDEEWELGGFAWATGQPLALTDRIRSKNFNSCMPNTAYYVGTKAIPFFYDADKNFISYDPSFGVVTSPSNAYYFKILEQDTTTYNHDICINLSSDRNGEYEPYTSQTYALGNDKLRGLFKLDANNNLYADGDTKTSDGTITRKYGTRAYQSGDESLADAITDGTTTVYKLTTPTTETSTPFQSPQICYPDGTEEFITENGVPVGHETEYPYDLKGLVEELIDVPDVPSANGTYVLKATRSASGITYNWVSE